MEWLANNWHYILISIVVVPMAAEVIAITIVCLRDRRTAKKQMIYYEDKTSDRRQ
jgi:hypothetical protein